MEIVKGKENIYTEGYFWIESSLGGEERTEIAESLRFNTPDEKLDFLQSPIGKKSLWRIARGGASCFVRIDDKVYVEKMTICRNGHSQELKRDDKASHNIYFLSPDVTSEIVVVGATKEDQQPVYLKVTYIRTSF